MTNTDTPRQHILVIGATGKTGSRVAARLADRAHTVRPGSRSADIPFDWTDQRTWGPALAGIDAVYVAFQPDLAVPGAPEAIRALTALAKSSGVRRLVLLSGRGEPETEESEQIVQDSGLDWTIVRCSWFNQNFDEGKFVDYILSGAVALPAGDVPEPFVDVDDIADVAVAALTEDKHNGQVYELTGPRALTFAEATAEIGRAIGRDIAFIPLSQAEFAASLAEYQVPDNEIALLDYLFGTVLDGRNSQVSDGVQRALGRAPKDFAAYARATAESGVWNTTESGVGDTAESDTEG